MTKSMKQEEESLYHFQRCVSCMPGRKAQFGIGKNSLSESCGSAALYCLWNLQNRLDRHPLDRHPLAITESILDPTLGRGLVYMDCKAPSQSYLCHNFLTSG